MLERHHVGALDPHNITSFSFFKTSDAQSLIQ